MFVLNDKISSLTLSSHSDTDVRKIKPLAGYC